MLAYQIVGKEKPGTPLIFLHGMLGERQNWNTQATHFSSHYRVITVDLRNHGESPHVKGMSYRQMADDVRELMQHLTISNAHFCGHSMGGKVAMLLALQYPEQVTKLAVIDIAPVKYPLWHQPVLQALLALPVSELKNRREADDLLAQAIDDPFERAFLLKNLQRSDTGFRWKCNLPEIARQYLKIASFPDVQQHFAGATLFIKGSDSNYITQDTEPAIYKYFPNAEIETITSAGHLPHIQQPHAFAETLGRFLPV